jgi:hypothetical protein
MNKVLLGGPRTVGFDSFTGANGTALTAHTLNTGQSWTHLLGTGLGQLEGNQAQLTSVASSGNVWSADFKQAAGQVSAQVNWGGTCDGGLAFRFSDANNGWYFDLSPPNTVQIIQHQAGSDVARASATVAVSTGANHQVKVTANGPVLTGWLDGAAVVSYSSTFNATATQAGLLVGGGANGVNLLFDNFQVGTLA